MNPFEHINELKQFIMTEVKNAGINKNYLGKDISEAEHYKQMLNMLNILENDMAEAEYNYQVESINHEVKVFNELTVLQKELNEDVIIFQPIAVGETELSAIDMQSLADVLTKLRDSGEIKENILLLPPNINVFKAKLAKTTE